VAPEKAQELASFKRIVRDKRALAYLKHPHLFSPDYETRRKIENSGIGAGMEKM